MVNARGYTFIGLNVVRALSLVALILVFASSIVTIVQDIRSVNAFVAAGKVDSSIRAVTDGTESDCLVLDNDYVEGSTVPNQPAGAFWAVLSRLLIIFQVVVLILSELGWPMSFFNRFFPILGDDFGLGALGVIQCLIGAAVLSHHVDKFSLVSAFFLFSLGCLNILLGLIYRERAKAHRSFTTWKDKRADSGSVLPTSAPRQFSLATGSSGVSWEKGGADDAKRSATLNSQRSGMGFGRQGEKAALARGYTINRPVEALPTYVPKHSGNVRPGARPVSVASADDEPTQ